MIISHLLKQTTTDTPLKNQQTTNWAQHWPSHWSQSRTPRLFLRWYYPDKLKNVPHLGTNQNSKLYPYLQLINAIGVHHKISWNELRRPAEMLLGPHPSIPIVINSIHPFPVHSKPSVGMGAHIWACKTWSYQNYGTTDLFSWVDRKHANTGREFTALGQCGE